jgi:hypothetical protein
MTSLAPQPGVVLVRRAGGQPVCRGRRQLKVSKPAQASYLALAG